MKLLVAGKLGEKKQVEVEFFMLSFHGCLSYQVEKGLILIEILVKEF